MSIPQQTELTILQKIEYMRRWSYGEPIEKYPSIWVSQLKVDPTLIGQLSQLKRDKVKTEDDITIFHWWIGAVFNLLPSQLVKV